MVGLIDPKTPRIMVGLIDPKTPAKKERKKEREVHAT
jgi:hypothetical protein